MKNFTLLLGFLPFLGFSQDTCLTAQLVIPGTYTITSIDGTEVPTPDCSGVGSESTHAEWYSFTATVDGVATVSSNLPENIEADVDTRLHVYSGACGALSCIGFNDDFDEDYISQVTFQTSAGATYYFVWDDYYAADGFLFTVSETTVSCTTALPATEDFSNPDSFYLCYAKEDLDQDGISWSHQFLDLDDDGTDEAFAVNESNENDVKNDWLFTPSYNLQAGTTYSISYRYNGADDFNDARETLQVLMTGGASSSAAFQQQIGLHQGITQIGDFEDLESSGVTKTAYFTPALSGAYNLAFHAISPANSGVLLLFNYSIEIALATPDFNKNKISLYPNPVNDILNISQHDAIDSVEIYNLMGQKVAGQKYSSNEVAMNLEQLSAGAYVVKVFSGNDKKTMKVIKK